MRKLLFLLPLLWAPALAGAAHSAPLEMAAYHMDASASVFYRRVERLRGNWRLKSEARRFARLSRQFASQASGSPSTRRLNRSLFRLDSAFHALQLAVANAGGRANRPGVRKRFRILARALNAVQKRAAKNIRHASAASRGAYRVSAGGNGQEVPRRRYRD